MATIYLKACVEFIGCICICKEAISNYSTNLSVVMCLDKAENQDTAFPLGRSFRLHKFQHSTSRDFTSRHVYRDCNSYITHNTLLYLVTFSKLLSTSPPTNVSAPSCHFHHRHGNSLVVHCDCKPHLPNPTQPSAK
jgi:hypothetical protein